jgi:Flp pilus assembly protein TadG
MQSVRVTSWKDERGTTAVEFAILGPVFLLLVVGFLYLCLSLFLVGSLHFAVEEGARCASIRTTVCSDNATTVAYAQSRYFGPSSPTFSYQAAVCGKSVTGAVNYVLELVIRRVTVPVTATACYP